MKISVIWTGYIWLIQSVWLAKLWFEVNALDIFEDKINQLKSWIPTIYEEWLQDLLSETLEKINFTCDKNIISGSDVVFICVWTPQDKTWKTDLSYIINVCKDIKNILKWNEIIIIKSTVPVWTNKMVSDIFEWKYSIVSNPEFLREWIAIWDFFNPDRIVLWYKESETQKTKNIINGIYKFFTNKWIKIYDFNWETAEIIKYASNAFLATKITFINEIARLADKTGANIKDIAKGMWSDNRIWSKFLNAGIGYGWWCFPKDVKSLIHQFKENWLDWDIVYHVDKVNFSQTDFFMNKIMKYYNNNLEWKTIWFLGIAFKPNTDDLRESRWLALIKELSKYNVKIKIFDYTYKTLDNFKIQYSNIKKVEICNAFEDIIKNSDFLIISLEDKKILEENLEILNQLRDKVIFDGKNILNKNTIENIWCKYFGVGY